ncbi:hypothetical protein MUP37_00525 [Candidatus Bathyarchaeota archaeon]|nr:hypothetical protein [Candidatus Bathyarchaeota archaeon]
MRARKKSNKGITQIPAESLSGEFINFPASVHGRSLVSYRSPMVRMQLAVVETMLNLDGRRETLQLSPSDLPREVEGTLSFEVGLANGVFFDRLDRQTANHILEHISSGRDRRILDFLIVVGYWYSRGVKTQALRSDHHQLRFLFSPGSFEALLYHSRGIRRLPLDDLFTTIFDELKRTLAREQLGKIRIELLETL